MTAITVPPDSPNPMAPSIMYEMEYRSTAMLAAQVCRCPVAHFVTWFCPTTTTKPLSARATPTTTVGRASTDPK
jgi:hypothetical protein